LCSVLCFDTGSSTLPHTLCPDTRCVLAHYLAWHTSQCAYLQAPSCKHKCSGKGTCIHACCNRMVATAPPVAPATAAPLTAASRNQDAPQTDECPLCAVFVGCRRHGTNKCPLSKTAPLVAASNPPVIYALAMNALKLQLDADGLARAWAALKRVDPNMLVGRLNDLALAGELIAPRWPERTYYLDQRRLRTATPGKEGCWSFAELCVAIRDLEQVDDDDDDAGQPTPGGSEVSASGQATPDGTPVKPRSALKLPVQALAAPSAPAHDAFSPSPDSRASSLIVKALVGGAAPKKKLTFQGDPPQAGQQGATMRDLAALAQGMSLASVLCTLPTALATFAVPTKSYGVKLGGDNDKSGKVRFSVHIPPLALATVAWPANFSLDDATRLVEDWEKHIIELMSDARRVLGVDPWCSQQEVSDFLGTVRIQMRTKNALHFPVYFEAADAVVKAWAFEKTRSGPSAVQLSVTDQEFQQVLLRAMATSARPPTRGAQGATGAPAPDGHKAKQAPKDRAEAAGPGKGAEGKPPCNSFNGGNGECGKMAPGSRCKMKNRFAHVCARCGSDKHGVLACTAPPK